MADPLMNNTGLVVCVSIAMTLIYLFLVWRCIKWAKKWKAQESGQSIDEQDKKELKKLENQLKREHPKILVRETDIFVFHKIKLGVGTFGDVYLGKQMFLKKDPAEPKPVFRKIYETAAIKKVNHLMPKTFLDLLKEALSMANLKHPNIISIKGLCLESRFGPMIVMDYSEGGSLKAYLTYARKFDRSPFSYGCALRLLRQAASAMAYLHDNGQLHCDLAARNILLTERNPELADAKVGDFGLSQDCTYYEMNQQSSRLFPATSMAPEVFLRGKFCPQSDIWAFGMLMWEIFTVGEVPLAGLTREAICAQVTSPNAQKRLLPRPVQMPGDLYQLIATCWELDYRERPNFHELVQKLAAVASTENSTFRLDSPVPIPNSLDPSTPLDPGPLAPAYKGVLSQLELSVARPWQAGVDNPGFVWSSTLSCDLPNPSISLTGSFHSPRLLETSPRYMNLNVGDLPSVGLHPAYI